MLWPTTTAARYHSFFIPTSSEVVVDGVTYIESSFSPFFIANPSSSIRKSEGSRGFRPKHQEPTSDEVGMKRSKTIDSSAE